MVVSTVLIILLVVISMTIIWNIAGGFVKEQTEKNKREIFDNRFEIEEVVFENNLAKVKVNKVSGDDQITELKIVFTDIDGKSYVYTENSNLPSKFETKVYSFENFNCNPLNIQKVSVFPMFDDVLGIESSENTDDLFPLSNNLLSCWEFDGDFTDSAGSNDGTPFGEAYIENNNLILDGDGDYVEVIDSPDFDVDNGYTYTAWINGDSFIGTHNMILGQNLPYISIRNNNKAFFSMKFSAIGQTSIVGNTVLSAGEWYFVTGSYDINDGLMRIYINGIEDVVSTTPYFDPMNDVSDLYIGTRNDQSTFPFNGKIDNVMIFNRALDIGEIQKLYNDQKK